MGSLEVGAARLAMRATQLVEQTLGLSSREPGHRTST